MTVINPSSISGITSITMPSGDGNVLTIHTNDGTERFRIDSSGNVKVGSAATISPDGDLFVTGVCTATTLAGSGANLTALPAAQVTGTLPAISGANLTSLTAGNLTGALPAISGANLTGIAATDNVRTGILDVAGIATFRNDVNLPNINGAQIGGRRNIIINGAMQVSQRGTSATTSQGFRLDRFGVYWSSVDETPSHEQADVASGTSPYVRGFRKCLKITNGNQTSGASAGSRVFLAYNVEAQDMANSGWRYMYNTSGDDFITFSFWVKSSVAQNFHGYLYTFDGTSQRYAYETGSLSANTWAKIEISIPGNSNLQFDNDNAGGFYITLGPYWGTNYTDAGVSLNTWGAWDGAERTPVDTTTWYTTNDATFEVTGFQLEVGSTATAFEHRSIGEETTLCHRYYRVQSKTRNSGANDGVSYVMMNSFPLSPPMRNTPTCAIYGSANYNSNVSSITTVNISNDHVGFIANISDAGYYYYNNGWTADAEI